jgi:hypothetical protein
MKKIGLILTILILVARFGFSQTTENTGVTKDDKKAPVITFENNGVHDFGNFFGGDAVFEFTFKNTGKTDLLLTDVHAGCGCTVIQDWPKEPIKKNKTGKIKVKYNNVTVPGKFNKVVTVTSNANNSPVTLTITGNVDQQYEKKTNPENTNTTIPKTN